jgi:hypothetical protein|uniref:Uncharacterized protein n=1 Tax=viral metagenome TaxID=1070528 RepID=A0A6C0BM83_9ZZZZ
MRTRTKITLRQAEQLSRHFHLNHEVVPFDQWVFGLNVELEHGTRTPLTNVTDDDLLTTAKITLAHILEFPNYYQKLEQMETQLEKEWNGRPFNVFLD